MNQSIRLTKSTLIKTPRWTHIFMIHIKIYTRPDKYSYIVVFQHLTMHEIILVWIQ